MQEAARSCSSSNALQPRPALRAVRWTGLDAAGDTWERLTLSPPSSRRPAAPPPHGAATAAARWRRRCTAANAAGRIRGRGGAARRPGHGARGPDPALLVARRRLAARHRRSALPARRLLARGGLSSRRCAAWRTAPDTLLDAASCGSRWVLQVPLPAPATGVARAFGFAPPGPTEFQVE